MDFLSFAKDDAAEPGEHVAFEGAGGGVIGHQTGDGGDFGAGIRSFIEAINGIGFSCSRLRTATGFSFWHGGLSLRHTSTGPDKSAFTQCYGAIKKGRDYSRSTTGTGMPLKNAFGTPDSSGVVQQRLSPMKFPVSLWTATEANANCVLVCCYICLI